MCSQRGFVKNKELPRGSHWCLSSPKTSILNVSCQKLSTKPYFGTQLKSSHEQMGLQKMLRIPSVQGLAWELGALRSSRAMCLFPMGRIRHCQPLRTSVQLWTLCYLLWCCLGVSIGCFRCYLWLLVRGTTTRYDRFVLFVLHLKSTKLVSVVSCEYGANLHQTWEMLLARCLFYEGFLRLFLGIEREKEMMLMHFVLLKIIRKPFEAEGTGVSSFSSLTFLSRYRLFD